MKEGTYKAFFVIDVESIGLHGEGYAVAEVDGWIVRSRCAERAPAVDDARAIAAALNALPALLAEVRAFLEGR